MSHPLIDSLNASLKTEAWIETDLNPGPPLMWQGAKNLSHHLLPPQLKSGAGQELEPISSAVESGHPRTCLSHVALCVSQH